MKKKLICIRCPRGCEIQTTLDGNEITEISGNVCKMGVEYVNDEIKDPKRVVTTTVRISDGELPLLPVWTEHPIPKAKVSELLDLLKPVVVNAPVAVNDIILKDIFNTGINVIASSSIKKIN